MNNLELLIRINIETDTGNVKVLDVMSPVAEDKKASGNKKPSLTAQKQAAKKEADAPQPQPQPAPKAAPKAAINPFDDEEPAEAVTVDMMRSALQKVAQTEGGLEWVTQTLSDVGAERVGAVSPEHYGRIYRAATAKLQQA